MWYRGVHPLQIRGPAALLLEECYYATCSKIRKENEFSSKFHLLASLKFKVVKPIKRNQSQFCSKQSNKHSLQNCILSFHNIENCYLIIYNIPL